jgi:hypothetical protein
MESGGKRHFFAPPPIDPEANRLVEENPRFPKAQKVSKVINVIGLGAAGLTVAAYIATGFTGWHSWVLDIIPLFTIALMPLLILAVALFRGLIWNNFRMSVPNPSVFPALLSISVALMLYGSLPNFIEYLPMWKMASVIGLFLLVAVFLSTPEFKRLTRLDVGNIVAIYLILLAYSYGAFTTSNCGLDQQPPKTVSTVITKKYSTKRSGDVQYHLTFAPVQGVDQD